MNILVVSQARNFVGGANRSLFDVIELLTGEYGYKCTVIVPGDGEFSSLLLSKGYDVHVFNYQQNTFTTLHDMYDAYRFSKAAITDLKNKYSAKNASNALKKSGLRFDLIYINDTSNTFGYYLSSFLKVPYVWHFRNYNGNVKRYMLHEKGLRTGENGKCIAISHAMRDYMISARKLDSNSIITIHNGVSNKCSDIHFPWHDRIKGNQFHCVHCGMLMEIKDQITSIKAMAILRDKGYSVFLHLAGPASIVRGESYQTLLEKLVTDLHINDRVIFEGNVENMASFRRNMAFELMCSKAEPFGRVTVEGMQAGLVVIGADTGATPEIIEDSHNGLLFKQGSAEDLAEKIECIIKDTELGDRIAWNGYNFTKNHFTMTENAKLINEAITSVSIT